MPEPTSPYVPPLALELADKVRAGLRMNKRTQAMLARRVGATEKHVSRVLTGHDDGSVPFWDAMLREAWAAPDPDLDRGNRPAQIGHSEEHASCCCGRVPWQGKGGSYVAEGVVHRVGGPCYVIEDEQAENPPSSPRRNDG